MGDSSLHPLHLNQGGSVAFSGSSAGEESQGETKMCGLRETPRISYLVDEVGSFDGPASRDFSSLNLDLLRQDVVPDLLARLAYVGALKI